MRDVGTCIPCIVVGKFLPAGLPEILQRNGVSSATVRERDTESHTYDNETIRRAPHLGSLMDGEGSQLTTEAIWNLVPPIDGGCA